MQSKTPVVTEMQVIPVAGYDSMEMTLSGAHAPFFTRNLVILKDSAGHTGIGEIHGGEYTCQCLESCIPLVVGQEVGKYRAVLGSIHRGGKKAAEDDGEGIQTLYISKLKFVVKAEWAIECALLDLLGQHLGVPVCELLAEGKQRDRVEVLGYLFYVSDKGKTDLPYLDESASSDPWFRMRRREMLTHEQIVEQACCLQEKYGFRNFKLKGGVFEGTYEMDTVRALKKQFPLGHINIDPNGAWSLEEAIRHINRYSTGHSDAILTEDAERAERFLNEVDSACVYVNASTRFTDGFEFGFGAEIGISTQKLHARGPMGLKELTSYKYVIRGNGQVRS